MTKATRTRRRGAEPVLENASPAVEVLGRDDLLRRMPWDGPDAPDWAPLVEREWLLTNGLGGYASGTVSGAQTRRYHGWLIGAFPPPVGRVLLLADIEERVRLPSGVEVRLGGVERPEALELHGARYLREFRLELGLPVWTYRIDGVVLERRLVLPHETNVACLTWHMLSGSGEVELAISPLLHFRSHDAPVGHLHNRDDYRATFEGDRLRVQGPADYPVLQLVMSGLDCGYREEPRVVEGLTYKVEASRGYDSIGDRWSPGWFRCRFGTERAAGLAAGPDGWPLPNALDPDPVRGETRRRVALLERAGRWASGGTAAELVLAADQFVILPPRERRVEGEAPCTVIAGYHWFTDWGRDTMISLEGLTLTTGRWHDARLILLTFGRHARDGLIPNLFPEGQSEGLYHTADATLWFFHAVDRYTAVTGDPTVLDELLPTFREIVRKHVEGTRFGIGVDPDDGLLRQGAEGYQLTWMDAKVGDWVVTPRRGKAVEINALWYNALRLLARWEAERGHAAAAAELEERAARTAASFNRRFWYAEGGHLYDVVDGEQGGDDPAFRPNQLFAVSLPHPVLEPARWAPVVEAVRQRLLTPVGLRSLAPGHPDYKPVYFGDLRTRDAAYHQGTVWGWLIGPFVDAWCRVHPENRAGARGLLEGFSNHLAESCLGTLAEVFDAEAPYTPRGCVAQAWTVAEVLRCWRMTGDG